MEIYVQNKGKVSKKTRKKIGEYIPNKNVNILQEFKDVLKSIGIL